MAQQAEVQYIQFYTKGSAAVKVAPVLQDDPYVLPKEPKRYKKVIHLDPFACIGFLVAACMLIAMGMGITHLKAAKQETALMEQYITDLAGENKRLERRYESSLHLDVIEKKAQALGMIPADQAAQGEISYVVPVPPVQEEPSMWERFTTFLAGIFA